MEHLVLLLLTLNLKPMLVHQQMNIPTGATIIAIPVETLSKEIRA